MTSAEKAISSRNRKRHILTGFAFLLVMAAVFLFTKWKEASDHGGQLPRKPFRIAGNLYYVGTRDVTSFLLTGPEGHVLIDGGYPGTAPMILKSIATLGFNIKDVKILLNSHAHLDHAGGLAELQRTSGAKLWISERDADIVASGGAADPTIGPFRLLAYIGLIKYPPPRVDHRFRDGAQVRLGPIMLTAHATPGHTPGCTTWAFPVQDAGRTLLAVIATDMVVLPTTSLVEPESYPGIRADFEHSFAVLRSLPTDIYLTSHARAFSLKRKSEERATAKDPVLPFIDRQGYLDDVKKAEDRFRQELRKQQQQ